MSIDITFDFLDINFGVCLYELRYIPEKWLVLEVKNEKEVKCEGKGMYTYLCLSVDLLKIFNINLAVFV